MAQPLKQVDLLRHELKALRFMLECLGQGRTDSAGLLVREDFQSAAGRQLFDAISQAQDGAAARAAIGKLDLEGVDLGSFLRLNGASYYSYPALVKQRARDWRRATRGGNGMNGAPPSPELYFLLDRHGGLIAFRENLAPWAGLLAFSSDEGAQQFCRASGAQEAEIVAVATSDEISLSAIINQVKPKGVRYLLLDLNYADGTCMRYEFERDGFGPCTPFRFQPPSH